MWLEDGPQESTWDGNGIVVREELLHHTGSYVSVLISEVTLKQEGTPHN